MSLRKALITLWKTLPVLLITAACTLPATPASPTATATGSSTKTAGSTATAVFTATAASTATGSSTATASFTATAAAPGQPTRTADEWQKLLSAAFAAQKAQSWRSESDILTAGGHTGHTTVEFVPPDRYHILSQPDTELILIGQQVFSQLNGQWSLVQIPAASILGADPLSGLEQSIPGLQCATPALLDGKPLHLCQYPTTTRIGDSDEALQNQLWIDPATNLPYQMIVDGAVGSMDTDTGQVTAVRATTTVRYTYDPALKIEPPQVAP